MKRILSWNLVLTLAVGLLPAQVFASQLENQEEQLVVQTEETLAQPEETVAATGETAAQPEDITAPAEQTETATEELTSVKATFAQPDEKADNDELLDGFLRKKFHSRAAAFSRMAGDRLSGDERTIYNALVPVIQSIAAGKREETYVYIGQTIILDGSYCYPDVSATFTSSGISEAGLGRIVNALLSDLPYDFYWYDKVIGCESISYSSGTMQQFQIAFTVADNYGPVYYYRVDTNLTSRAASSAANSLAIVNKYADKSDYEKLVGYKDEICKLVTYDDEAAYYGYFSENNDPWQLIHVFDGDSTTNVVCEGYSKAFMYLCEQTYFSGDVSCVLATGVMGGPHMWNIVQIAGKNYLVDVTNSESDCVGRDGRLFLAGGSGSISYGYTVGGYTYTYDDDTKSTWGTGSSSILALDSKTYSPPVVHTHSYSFVVTPPTCTQQGYTAYSCACGYSYKGDYVPALNHSYTETVTKPTFTSEGYTDFYCTRCGYSYRGNYKAPLELSAPEVRYQSGALEFGEYIEGFVYEIYRSTSKSGSFKLVDEIVAEACRWEDTTGTAGKTYYYKAKAVSNNGAYASVFSKVVSMPICCDEPELTVEAGATGKPVLTWNKVSGAKKYEIHRSIDGGSFKKLTTTTKTTYTDTKATAGAECTYKIKVVASKSTYNSGYSATDSCYVTCAAPSLTVKIDTATGKPSLSWSKVSNATGYVIFRGVNGGEYAYLTTVTGTSYKDLDTLADNQYSYKMQTLGKEDVFNSPLSAAKSVTVTVGQPKLTGTVNDDGKPVITWGAVEDAVLYKVYRSTSATKSYKLVYTTEGFEYTDTSVSAGKSYYYKVLAVGQNSENYSSYIKLTGKCDVPEMTVKAGSTGKPVLTWNKISGAKKYEIWRSVNGAAFKKLTTTTKTTYTDTKATEGAECTYKVKALGSKSSYNSLFSETGSCYVTCAVPTVTAKVDAATGKPSLSWSKVTGATGYDIYRSENGGGFEKLTNVTDTTYLDEATKADNKYTYYILSVGKAEVFNSVNSAEKTVTVTVAQPKLTGSINEAGKAVITWNAVEDAVKYEIYRSTKANKSYKLVDTVTELTYTDTGITAGKTYYYKVVAVGSNSKSAQSAYVKLTGKCAQPVISVGFDQNSGKPVITWEKVTGAKKYELYRSTDGENHTKLTTVTKTTYTDTKAKTGTFYYYQVRAVGSKSSYNSVFSQRRGCLCVCAKPVVTVKMDSKQWQPALTWKTVEGAESYEIYRALRGGNFVLLATVTEPAYLDQTAQIGDLYRYKVKALSSQPLCNMEGDQVLFSVPCEKVTVKAVADPTGKPALTWEATEGATVYAVYRSTKKSSGFKLYSQVITTSYTDKNAKKGTTYYYYVTAMAQDTESAVSNTVKIKCSK